MLSGPQQLSTRRERLGLDGHWRRIDWLMTRTECPLAQRRVFVDETIRLREAFGGGL